jgi:glycine oxidase
VHSPNTEPMTADVAVVGAGLIGLAIAWRVAQRGLSVILIDPAPGSGASHYGAGMLAPVTEVHYGEETLLRLNLAAAERYPSFVAEVEDATGTAVGYRECGTVAVAFDADDRAVLADLHAYQRSLGLSSHVLTSRECRALEPALTPMVRGGLLVDGDHQVDNRRLTAALIVACERAGVAFHPATARRFVVEDDRVVGVDDVRTATVVLAAGCWSGSITGLPPDAVPPVRPVKGQILRLRADADRPLIGRSVRAVVRGRAVYLVPRSDGEIVLGATSEEMGFDRRTTVGATAELLADARQLLPGSSELELVEVAAGLRPGSPDNAPMIGPASIDGLMIATGHYRNGILLTPITADAVAARIADGRDDDRFAAFDPRRFAARDDVRSSARLEPEATGT